MNLLFVINKVTKIGRSGQIWVLKIGQI
jgi:hypothetical protein